MSAAAATMRPTGYHCDHLAALVRATQHGKIGERPGGSADADREDEAGDRGEPERRSTSEPARAATSPARWLQPSATIIKGKGAA